MRVALAQINASVGDLSGNHLKMSECIKQSKRQDADVVVFPELSLCGYPPEDLLLKDHFVKDNIQELKALAKKVSGITVIAGFVDQEKNGNLYNAAAIISEGKIKGIYRKEVLPNYGVFDEKRYFQEGRKNPLIVFGDNVIGLNICEDIWPEKGAHVWQKKEGAKVLINMSSSPYDIGKQTQREKLLIERAKKHKVYVCYVNLVGGQDELIFDGGSLVVEPSGKLMACAKQFEEDLLVVDLPLNPKKKPGKRGGRKHVLVSESCEKKKSIGKHNAVRLSDLERVYAALVLGTRDYVMKNGFKKVVIGLSGGIDSALVAAIARDAVGKKNVVGVSMPSQYSSAGTQSDAKKLAKNLGIKCLEVPIQETYDVYLKTLKSSFAGTKPGVTEENLQARIRGNILMAFSNKFGWLVLTTGNKSEVAVGYCTLYGDMSGGFAVIKDVPKTMVYELAGHVNRKKKWIPESIIKRAPSAELRENQKDQDSLPDYGTLDEMIKLYVEDHKSFATMTRKNKDADLVKRIIQMVDKSEYKRRQAPPGIKITPRAFGKDWRLPITNKYKER